MSRENLLEKVIKKIEEIEPDKWLRIKRTGGKESLITYSTKIENFGVDLESHYDQDAFTSYYANIDNIQILLERIRPTDLMLEYRFRIYRYGSDLAFDDEGIDTNDPIIASLRGLFHDVESYFNKKPADKNRRLLGELLEKLK